MNTSQVKKTARVRGISKLLLYMIIGGTIGYIFASGSVKVPEDFQLNIKLVYEYDLLFGFIALVSLLLAVWNATGLLRVGSMPREDEDFVLSPAEKLLGNLMKTSSYNVIISLMWTFLSLAYALGAQEQPAEDKTFMLVNMITAVVFILVTFLLQHHTLVKYNKYYPERTLDLRVGNTREAQREFFAKLDEAERWTVYRSSFAAFKATNSTLIGGIVLFTLYSLFFGFAPLPIIVLALILLIQQGAYYREAGKLSK
ncbi:hypothetical protein GCM10010912_29180 [Paenibacillus albidus]|uniref:DUF3169 family protein n=1 Tax=Paenibacillus albidus TaxID=2041023 RepID=A0A917CDC2_9BACL|nr:DUF3169 family protein [Paenibacillus albidus]GGF82223.1 hypothetical protein GCM10010912_29180 [Paenibacillus albidus]